MNLKTTIACYWVIVKSNGRILYSWGGGKGALVSIASNSIASATVGTAPELIAPPPDGWFLRKARRDIDLFEKKSGNKHLSYRTLTPSFFFIETIPEWSKRYLPWPEIGILHFFKYTWRYVCKPKIKKNDLTSVTINPKRIIF